MRGLGKATAQMATYQLAAMIGFPLGLRWRLDLGFCFTFGIDDLFFFFWSSRPMAALQNG
jgi:hypothetical protein